MAAEEDHLEITRVLDRAAVERKKNIAGLEPGFAGRSVLENVRHDHPAMAWQCDSGRQRRRDVLHKHADFAAVDMPLLLELLVDVLHHVAGNSESDTLAAARLRED